MVWSARSGELRSARHAPALPRQPHASPCLPFISSTSVFPEGGDALLPPRQGPGGLSTLTLQGLKPAAGVSWGRSRGPQAWSLVLNQDFWPLGEKEKP